MTEAVATEPWLLPVVATLLEAVELNMTLSTHHYALHSGPCYCIRGQSHWSTEVVLVGLDPAYHIHTGSGRSCCCAVAAEFAAAAAAAAAPVGSHMAY